MPLDLEDLSSEARLGFGAASLSLNEDRDDSRSLALLATALDLGIRIFDTATAYTPVGQAHHNERLLAQALSAQPSGAEAFVVTKAGHWRASAGDFPIDGSPDRLEQHVQESLSALGTDALDACLLHWPDPNVPIETSIAALADLRDRGLVRRVGLSNVSLSEYRRAQSVTEIDIVENRFSILSPSAPGLVEAVTHDRGLFLAYGPLSGRDGSHDPAPLEPLAPFAHDRGTSVQQVALAWLLAQSPRVIPLVGSTRAATLTDSVGATALHLDGEDLRTIRHAMRST